MKQLLSTMIKRAASSEALMRPIASAADFMMDDRGCLVTFHRAAPEAIWESLPNREFYLDLDFLDRFLSYLTDRGWDIVTIEEALRRSALDDHAGRFINFSIDDCYRDAFEDIVPLFRRHGVPVTLFVTTGIPDGTLPLWAAGLEDVLLHRDCVTLEDGVMELRTPEDKTAAFHIIAESWDGPEAGARYAKFCELNGVDREAMHWKHAISWEMLETLRDDPLVEIGAHTLSHARISSLSMIDAFTELQGSRQRLIEKLDIPVRHFAFPYGRSGDCGPRDFELAREAGFTSAATTRKGLMRAGQAPFELPRNTLNGAHRSLATMELHLTGLTGAVARMTGRV